MTSLSLALSSLLFYLFLNLPILALAKEGFSVELIHRDSPKSPLYDPSKTLSEQLLEASRHSINRANHIHRTFFSLIASNDPYRSEVNFQAGTYLMTINIGTPAQEILAIADTSSDLIWTKCVPCPQCYPQLGNIFDPTKSKTYSQISSMSDNCTELVESSSIIGTICQYNYQYGDGSKSSGQLSSETFNFDSTSGQHIHIPRVLFGCSYQTNGTFNNHSAGIIGLGAGSLSLISQLGSTIDKKFSYCLVPYSNNSSSSRLSFGESAVVSGPNVVSTPLVQSKKDTFYTASLQSITLEGHDIVEINKDVIFDSSTTLTFLERSVVEALVKQVSSIINLPKVNDPNGLFNLCFNVNKNLETQFPDITFQFDEAAVKLKPLNTFVQLNDHIACLAIVTIGQSRNIIGNLAQQNFRIGFDLVSKKISFSPTDCTKI